MIDSISKKQAYYQVPVQHVSSDKISILIDLLSTNGRMGRFSYFFYSTVSPFLLFWVMAASAGVIGKMGGVGILVANIILSLTALSILYLIIQLTIKRSHDFNASGWISPLIFIPFACLFFLFMPGNRGTNNYGSEPEPSSILLKTGSLILITLLVAAITYTALTKLM